MNPDDARWIEIDALLRESLLQPEDEQRDYVTNRTGSDLELCNAVHALLDVGKKLEHFLEKPYRIDMESTRELFMKIALRAVQTSPDEELS